MNERSRPCQKVWVRAAPGLMAAYVRSPLRSRHTPPERGAKPSNKSQEAAMKVLFIISSSDTAFWLSEVTHPYWHFIERGLEVDFASPSGGKVVYDPYSDPYFKNSTESEALVSRGFLSDPQWVPNLEGRLTLRTSTCQSTMQCTSPAAVA